MGAVTRWRRTQTLPVAAAVAVASHSLTVRPGEGGGVCRWRAGKRLAVQGGLLFPWEAEQHPKRGERARGGGVAAPGRENRLRGILRTGPLSVAVSRFVCEILGMEGRERVLLA